MKLSLATKITVLVQTLFLIATILMVLLIQHQVDQLFDVSSTEFYETQINDVIHELQLKEQRLRTLLPEPEPYMESFQNTALEDLRRTYYTDPGRKPYLFIVNAAGSVLLHPRLETGNRSLQSIFPPAFDTVDKGRTVMRKNGENFQVFFARFPAWQWTVCWAVPDTIKTAVMQKLRTGIIAILIASLVVMGLALTYLIPLLVKPISELTKMVNSIARGNAVQPAHTDRQDEIGTLTRTFIRMQNIIRKKINQLHISENRYRSLFDSANDAILIRNEEGICIACNRKALELFGCSQEQLIGHTPGAVSPELQPDGNNSAEKAKELIGKALQGATLSQEWQIKRFDGDTCDVQATVSSFEANGLKFAQVVLTDITRQKRMEVELRQAQKMEGIGTLAGGIAHDFNNILSAIIGYTELAQMKVSRDSEIAKDLIQIRKASERASGLVRQILTFSRKQKHEDSALQINLIVKEALKLIRSSIPTTIEIEQKITTNAAVRTDPTLIHQLIMNLCTNAYQAMLEKGGKLTVAMHEIVLDSNIPQQEIDLPDGKYISIEISDTGYGMHQKIMAKIFDPFFTTKEQGRGTGLGLAVVHDIVKELNGGITVLSEPGAGTTFNVFLPVAEEEEKTQDQPTDQNLSAKENERIMVVDDEPAIRDLMQAILSSAGYQVDLFENGEDAWLAFSTKPEKWRLIITDQTMPKMTGTQLAVQALEITPDIPVILCTGYSESISVDKALELGIRTYLHKPISLNELLAVVHEVLDK